MADCERSNGLLIMTKLEFMCIKAELVNPGIFIAELGIILP